MPTPEIVIDLVKRFEDNKDTYLSGRYNETELRRDFLDPFFEALGWDVRNVNNHSEKYRDVIHEQSVEVEGQAKSADYLFKIGDTPIFFVEAKKPSVDIVNNPGPAFQLKTYAWSKKLTLSLLSDFETLAFYECTSRPRFNAPPAKDRVDLYSYKEYISRWEEISGKISRSAVTSGAYDRYVQDVKGKHGTTDVDDDFLVEMERWRNELAHNIALRNPSISQRELNFAVQATIDRIIFLRICEDRGIEPEGSLKDATDGVDVYGDLIELFRKADKRYNSGLFHFENEKGRAGYPDTLTPNLKIDDKVFKDILSNLYLPKSPYAFRYFSADILGQVYERFLGKVITLTPGHRAQVELKPEVRKAGGVYYTPTYIVDYIVNNTVGEILKDKTPELLRSDPIRILDPACGSGSFLIGAFQYLMDWYLDWYINNDTSKWAKGKSPAIMETLGGWQLTLDKKKQILLNHIFGVDIDYQAVEVTKLSLLFKVVENPGQLSLLEERILPDLNGNIKCGNSLIEEDYFSNMLVPDEEERNMINPFEWRKGFPLVFEKGGFDAVIGNPPYFSAVTLIHAQQDYFSKKYGNLWASRNDISYYFLLTAIQLCKGSTSFIMPRYYLNSFYAKKIREFLITKGSIKITDTGNDQCFEGVNILTTIIKVSKGSEKGVTYHLSNTKDNKVNHYDTFFVQKEQISSDNWNFSHNQLLLEKIGFRKAKLIDFFMIAKGMSTGFNQAFEIKDEKSDLFQNRSYLLPLIKNGDIRRYEVLDKGSRSVIYLENVDNINSLPEYKTHLLKHIKELKSRSSAKGKWFHYSTPRNKELWEKQTTKIVVPFMATENRFALEERNVVSTSGDVNALILKPGIQGYDQKYFLGLLNSKLLDFYHRNTTKLKRGGYMEYVTKQLSGIPIREIDFINPNDKYQYDHLIALVGRMLELHKRRPTSPHEQEQVNREIETTDHRIDLLVYELYGLTDEEIRIVEGEN